MTNTPHDNLPDDELEGMLLDQEPGSVSNPYEDDDFDGTQDPESVDEEPRSFVATEKFAGRNTHDSIAWIHNEQDLGHKYPRLCLQMQRMARDIPPVAPTAFIASQMVPDSERFPRVRDLRRGMNGYSKGADPAGHIYDILGRRKGFDLDDPDGVVTISNDVVAGNKGAIGVVLLSFYKVHWNYDWQFGGTRLNGYDFRDFNAKPKPVHPTLGANYEQAIKAVKKAIRAHKGDTRLEEALARDLERMERKLKRFS